MIYNEDFETLPREVLETLQLKRLKQVVQRVYHTVGFYRRAFDEAGVQPDDHQLPRRSEEIPLHHEAGPPGQLPLRHVRRPDEQRRAPSRLLRDDRPRDRRRLHQARHRHLVGADGPLPGRRGTHEERHHPQRLRLRPLHRGPGRPLRGGEAGGERHPHVRRQHEAADHDPPGFRPDGDLLHPLLRAEPRGAGQGDGGRHEVPEAPGRDLRRRTLERKDAAGDRKRPGHHRAQHLRPLGDHGPRGRHGVHGGPPRHAHLRRPLPRGDDQPRNRRGPAAGRRGGARLHDDHEGGLPPDPLPDAGHLPPDRRNPAGAAGRSPGWIASRAAATTC